VSDGSVLEDPQHPVTSPLQFIIYPDDFAAPTFRLGRGLHCGLAAGSWAALQSCTLTNGLFYFSDPDWKNYPDRFYRLRWP